MKSLFTVVFALLISVSCYAQKTFKYNIDNIEYVIDEQNMNTMFGNAFNDLIQRNWTESKYFDIWSDSYRAWKVYASGGTYKIELYGDRLANFSFTGGIPREFLGWKSQGKSGTGNPNKKSNLASRMGLFNNAMNKQIVYYCTGKTIIN